MPIDVNKVLDYEFKTIDFDWDADKVILYHLGVGAGADWLNPCLLYTSPSPRD